jgi:ATP-binding cassette, subfamily B, multidrug efflux pump
MRKLLRYMKNYKKESVLAPLFKLLEASFELITPLIIASIIDTGIANGDKGYVLSRVLMLVGFGCVGMVSAITAQYFAAKAAVGFATELRHSLFEKINDLSFSLLDKVGTSTLLTRITTDVNTVQNGVNLVLRLFMRSPFIVFGACIMAATVDLGSLPLFLTVVVLLSIVVFGIMLLTIKRYKAIQNQLDSVMNTTRENLNGARVIRAFCSEETETEKFVSQNSLLSKLQKSTGKISALMNPVTYIIINTGIVVLIYYGALKVDSGRLTQGQVVALYNYMSQILVELVKLANLIITITKAFASAGRISDVLDIDTSIVYTDDKSNNGTAVEFDNVSIKYNEGANDALSNVSFTAQPGQIIGVIGGTGSGKTTLVSLISRFYDATEGKVLLGGKDVRSYSLDEIRNKVHVVLQRAVLFHGSLRDNLLWGNKNASDDEMLSAVKAAQASDFVLEKGGLDMEITAEGRNLSGGQRQRLSIARALVGSPEVLILDDSASALDYVTEKALRGALAQLENKPTLFIVSQRTSSLRHADKILVLDDGALVGCGSHDELLENCEVYREIYDSQFGGKESAKK